MRIKKSVLFILLLIIIGLSVFVYKRYIHDVKSDDIISQASKLIRLPNSTSTLILLDNAEDLKKQKFFDGAMPGDYLIIYPEEGRAFIYSPKSNMIINAGPIQTDNQATSTNTVTGQ